MMLEVCSNSFLYASFYHNAILNMVLTSSRRAQWLFSPRICDSWKADTESRRVQLWRSPNGNRQRKEPQRQEITSRSTKSPWNGSELFDSVFQLESWYENVTVILVWISIEISVPRFRRGLYTRRACCPSWSIHRWRGRPTLTRLADISRSGFYAPKWCPKRAPPCLRSRKCWKAR